jgi:hypothetical protein
MAETSWGPIHKATTDGDGLGAEEGTVTQPKEKGSGSPTHPMNYDATDGRHSKPNHEGWVSVDGKSGEGWESAGAKFPDGPGPWRQT